MIKAHCEICNAEVGQALNQPIHFCSKHIEFAEDFLTERKKALDMAMRTVEKTMEAFRHKYLTEKVIPVTKQPKFEVVAK